MQFHDPFIRERLSAQIQHIGSSPTDQFAVHARSILLSMRESPQRWDEKTSANREWIGDDFVRSLEEQTPQLGPLFVMCFRFLKEYEFNTPVSTRLSTDLDSALAFGQNSIGTFAPAIERDMRYAFFAMPADLMRRVAHTEAVLTVSNWTQRADKTEERLTAWEADLTAKETRVTQLAESLQRYKHAFNFVGLQDGFRDLHAKKVKEQGIQLSVLIALGFAVLLPAVVALTGSVALGVPVDWFREHALVVGVPALSLTILVLYYFRIVLMAYNGTKSQLLQIDLRMTLCRFIQGYVDYANELRKESSESLTRFESIVFSAITSDDSKLPPTFDPLDQIASLIRQARGKEN